MTSPPIPERSSMLKRLVLPALALLLISGTIAWATAGDQNDPTTPMTPGADAPPGGLPPGTTPGVPLGQPPGGLPPGRPPGPPMGVFGQPPLPPGVGARIDYKEVVPVLIDALGDDDGEVRQYVAHTLARIGRPAVTPLVGILKDKEKSKDRRANAAYVLGKIGPQAREAVPVLAKALKESDRELRRRAAFALANVIGEDYGFPGMPGGFNPMTGMADGTRSKPLPDPGVLLPSHERDSKKEGRTKSDASK